MSVSLVEVLLYDLFKAQGAIDAVGLAHRAAQDYALAERNQKIYELATVNHIKSQALAERYGISTRQIRQIVLAQAEIVKCQSKETK